MPNPINPASPLAGAAVGPAAAATADEGLAQAKSKKTGYLYLPRISKDAGLLVMGSALRRVAGEKQPYAVIVRTEEDKARLRAAIRACNTTGEVGAQAKYFTTHGSAAIASTIETGAGLRREKALLSQVANRAVLREAEIEIKSVERDKALAKLDPSTTKLYLFGHGCAAGGASTLAYKMPNEERVNLTHHELAKELKRQRLPRHYQDIRMMSCYGSKVPTDPSRGSEPTALRLANAMGKVGFRAVKITAYEGEMFVAPRMLQDGKMHQAVDVAPKGSEAQFKRASTVRAEFTPENLPRQLKLPRFLKDFFAR